MGTYHLAIFLEPCNFQDKKNNPTVGNTSFVHHILRTSEYKFPKTLIHPAPESSPHTYYRAKD